MQNQLNVVVLGNYVLSIRSEDSQIQELLIEARKFAKVLRVDEYSGSGFCMPLYAAIVRSNVKLSGGALAESAGAFCWPRCSPQNELITQKSFS